jgi:hypothetical protein
MFNREAGVSAGAEARLAFGPQTAGRRAPEVRVISAELGAGRGGDVRSVVRACVYLDTLLPADVRVELVVGRPGEDAARMRETDVRLWSVQSYGNGSFLFESTMPALALGAGEGPGVRVASRDDESRAPSMSPVVRWLPTSDLADSPERVPRRASGLLGRRTSPTTRSIPPLDDASHDAGRAPGR